MNDTNKRYIEKVIIDLVISKHVIRYRYYPDEFGKYNIPKYVQPINFTNEIVEQICELIDKASNKGINFVDVKELDTQRLNKEMIRILTEELEFTVINYIAVNEFRIQW